MKLQLIEAKKVYGTAHGRQYAALTDVSLTIEQGEFVAIVGKSGAGKSTLLHLLGCMDTLTAGQYLVDGEAVEHAPDARLAALRCRRFGFVMQDFALIRDLSVLENVTLPALFDRRAYPGCRTRGQTLLTQVGLRELMNKKVNQLSGGEQQRTAIARALINQPDALLADEPTGNLDGQTSAGVFDLFRRLNREGKTVVLVTHDEDLARQCGRLVRVSDGRIVEDSGR